MLDVQRLSMPVKTLIVIAGPTAVGKTALSIDIAKELHVPIVSADSRQFFREMTIGTAKPTPEEMKDVPHYLVGSHSITEDYNVGKYEAEVIPLLTVLFKEHDQVILTGGSGLYIDAVCKGFDELPEADPEIRQRINSLMSEKGVEGLAALLRELDPEYHSKADMKNPQRMSRALEVCLSTGKPYSQLRKGKQKKRDFEIIRIGLNIDRELLYERINHRVDEMMSHGLLDEAKRLFPLRHLNALQTVGYSELFEYLEGKISLDEAVVKIKQNTRNFAKRQLTWFRRDEEMKWFEPSQLTEILEFINNKEKK